MLGIAWASPATLVCLLVATLLCFTGWVEWFGRVGDALVWRKTTGAPRWTTWFWFGHHAWVMGNCVVFSVWHGDETGVRGQAWHHTIRHQQEHVSQWMRLGPFTPILWFASWLTLAFSRHAHPHFDHPMEIDARRAAGQTVDVIGTLKSLAKKVKRQ